MDVTNAKNYKKRRIKFFVWKLNFASLCHRAVTSSLMLLFFFPLHELFCHKLDFEVFFIGFSEILMWNMIEYCMWQVENTLALLSMSTQMEDQVCIVFVRLFFYNVEARLLLIHFRFKM